MTETGLNLNGISIEFKSQINGSKTKFHTNGEMGCNKADFEKKNPSCNIFEQLDTNKDGYISEKEWQIQLSMAGEDKILTEKERTDTAMQTAIYFASRNIDKWFKIDRDRNGILKNVLFAKSSLHT